MIALATSLFKKINIDNKTQMNIANIVAMYWLNKYSKPRNLTSGGCNHFTTDFTKVMREKFKLVVKSTRNLQGNSVLEKIN